MPEAGTVIALMSGQYRHEDGVMFALERNNAVLRLGQFQPKTGATRLDGLFEIFVTRLCSISSPNDGWYTAQYTHYLAVVIQNNHISHSDHGISDVTQVVLAATTSPSRCS